MKHWSIPAPYSIVLKLFAPPSVASATRVKIKNLDLEPIKFKLVKEGGWTVEKADRVAVLYKGFLTLHALYPEGTHVPTHEIDDMWHAHILDTAKYMADCHDVFGYYLHHFPYLGLRGDEDAVHADESFKATRQRFIEACGMDPLAGDDISASDCGGGGGCSSSSCSSSSCSSGNDSGGSHGNDTPGGGKGSGGGGKSSCATYLPFNDPAAGNTGGGSSDRSRRPPAPANDRRPEPQRPLWRRILGLSGRTEVKGWEQSVDPASRLATAKRPGRDELMMLAEKAPVGVTKH